MKYIFKISPSKLFIIIGIYRGVAYASGMDSKFSSEEDSPSHQIVGNHSGSSRLGKSLTPRRSTAKNRWLVHAESPREIEFFPDTSDENAVMRYRVLVVPIPGESSRRVRKVRIKLAVEFMDKDNGAANLLNYTKIFNRLRDRLNIREKELAKSLEMLTSDQGITYLQYSFALTVSKERQGDQGRWDLVCQRLRDILVNLHLDADLAEEYFRRDDLKIADRCFRLLHPIIIETLGYAKKIRWKFLNGSLEKV